MDEAEAKKLIKAAHLRKYADKWEQPGAEQVRAILTLAGLTGSAAASILGISDGRTVRRWTGGDSIISYANWAILCDLAGYGKIWE
jgi:hypothetical protein